MRLIFFLTISILFFGCSGETENETQQISNDSDSLIVEESKVSVQEKSTLIKPEKIKTEYLKNSLWINSIFDGCTDTLKFISEDSAILYHCEREYSVNIGYNISNDTLHMNVYDYGEDNETIELQSKYSFIKTNNHLKYTFIAHKYGDGYDEVNQEVYDNLTDFSLLQIDSLNEDNNCIFDLSTQDDEFLKDNIVFNDYVWDQKEKTATIIRKDTLITIYRGGCNHFSVQAEITISSKNIDFKNVENWTKPALWLAKNISNEFKYDSIKAEIKKNAFQIIVDNDGLEYKNMSFNNQYLQDNGYEVYYNKQNFNKVKIGISKMLY